jgi:glycosyltransferase involved in cell wall biosynthesis
LKIAIIVNPLIPVPPDKYGGIERIVYMLIQQLMALGHNVTLFANSNSKPNCTLTSYHESERYGVIDFIRINLLTAKINFQGYDLVHTFGRMSNIASLMLFKIPKIVSYQLPPTISQIKKAVKVAYPGSLYFTGCSNYISNQIVPYGKTTTVYNGVNLDDYSFKEYVSADAPLVFLGRIQTEKGTHIAIDVALKTNKKLVIAGNIPNEKLHHRYFKNMVEPHVENDRITYIGPVNNSQKNELLQNALCLLMPITWDEPFGIVMTEALACGTPVIGFNKGSVPEVITNGLNGFVCDSLREMISAVEMLPSISRKNCRSVVEEKFSATVLSKQYEELYLLAAKK